MTKNDLVHLEASICKDSLYEFIKRAWKVIEPSTVYVDNWHIKAICNYLEASVKGDIHNLIINIPPRHMKSLICNVFFPAWVWSFAPEKKFLFASYGEDLAIRDSLLCRKLITSEWYLDRWKVELLKDQNQKSRYENSSGGYRVCFGFGGGITGEGGDFIVIDDPLKSSDANSDAVRNQVNYVYDNTLSTRLNDPKTGVKILIMQRLHDDDLTGHIIAGKEPVEHLCLPAEYEGIRFTSSLNFVDPRTTNGELLWPDRFGEKELTSIKNTLSELGIAGQLQQRPTPVSGYIFKREWVQDRINNSDIIARYISWDTASSDSDQAAYSSAVVGELTSDYKLFIRYVYRDKLQFPQLKDQIESLASKYKYKLSAIIIESKSSGMSVIQSLSQSSEQWISEILVPFLPTSDKVARATTASLWVENGSVVFPPYNSEYDFLHTFEEELFNFPQGKYKDQTDAFVQLILYLENYLSSGLRSRQ